MDNDPTLGLTARMMAHADEVDHSADVFGSNITWSALILASRDTRDIPRAQKIADALAFMREEGRRKRPLHWSLSGPTAHSRG